MFLKFVIGRLDVITVIIYIQVKPYISIIQYNIFKYI